VARPKSILLFGEGKTDAVFLAHLCHIYRSPAVITKVEHGKGGSDQTVVQTAIKIARLADYSGSWSCWILIATTAQSRLTGARRTDY